MGTSTYIVYHTIQLSCLFVMGGYGSHLCQHNRNGMVLFIHQHFGSRQWPTSFYVCAP